MKINRKQFYKKLDELIKEKDLEKIKELGKLVC